MHVRCMCGAVGRPAESLALGTGGPNLESLDVVALAVGLVVAARSEWVPPMVLARRDTCRQWSNWT